MQELLKSNTNDRYRVSRSMEDIYTLVQQMVHTKLLTQKLENVFAKQKQLELYHRFHARY
jgi:hypothetical protein